MPRFVEVAKKSEIPETGVIGVEVEGKRLALMNLKGEIYAIDDDCPHEGDPSPKGKSSARKSNVHGTRRTSTSRPAASPWTPRRNTSPRTACAWLAMRWK